MFSHLYSPLQRLSLMGTKKYFIFHAAVVSLNFVVINDAYFIWKGFCSFFTRKKSGTGTMYNLKSTVAEVYLTNFKMLVLLVVYNGH